MESVHPNPAHIFESVNAFQKTAALKAAIELDLFSLIAMGNTTAGELSEASRSTERGTRILCDFLVVNGFLTKDETHYGLTPDSAVFLDKRSPVYLGGTIKFLLAPQITDQFQNLTATVRTGGAVAADSGNMSHENPVWEEFARAMMPMMQLPARVLAQLVNGDSTEPIKVLDIAAGHGIFGLSFARENPNAKIVALDWPRVLEVAGENARREKLDDRFSIIAGDAFSVDFGSDYDLVLMPNFLHHFDHEQCVTLLRKAYAALNADGRIVIVDFMPNEDRVSPPMQAAFALIMLASTPAGDVYTFHQFETMCREAGFGNCEYHALAPTMQQALIGTK